MATITHKQGDTLEWVITLTESGASVDITDWSIRAHIRQNDTLISALTVVLTNSPNGVFSLNATAAQTDTWSAGTHSCDIEFTDSSGEVFSTETFSVTILEDISHD
jgi:menaquinone-dependent protoporphyrinogen IX oxidase